MDPEQTEIELFKYAIDFFKHVTTLSSGSILLLATFLEKLFQKPHLGFLVAISFASFAVSIIGAFVAICVSLGGTKATGPSIAVGGWFQVCFILSASGGFIIGMLSLAIFGTVNFFWH